MFYDPGCLVVMRHLGLAFLTTAIGQKISERNDFEMSHDGDKQG
jgi:hypothetical protein